jgi:hypothetical protein
MEMRGSKWQVERDQDPAVEEEVLSRTLCRIVS